MLVTQSYLTLCDPIDYSPQGSSVHGILQARILEWLLGGEILSLNEYKYYSISTQKTLGIFLQSQRTI